MNKTRIEMQQKILIGKALNYVSTLLNINLDENDNDLIIQDIYQELNSLNDVPDFVQYLKKNYNHYNLRYMNGFQKFLWLVEKYKNIELDKKAYFDLSPIKLILQKIKLIEISFNEYGEYREYKNKETKECLFTPFELSLLEPIGTLSYVICKQYASSCENALEVALQEQFKKHLLNNTTTTQSKQITGAAS